ncbi:MAG: T9SS type A sorting domain-containing protein, partial [Bacteroidota bacterium]
CKAAADALFEDDNLKNKIGRYVFGKFTDMLGPDGSKGFCGLNSATVGCEKFCERASYDPNIKIGPGDNNLLRHVNYLGAHGYTIFFENLPAATAPAAYAEITDTIDMSRFDIQTLQLTGFSWGDSLVKIDANRNNYSVVKDLRPAKPNLLRIDFRLDTIKGIAKWKFYTLDTATLQLTDDPDQGFLPPNTDGTSGTGFVSFTIEPKAGVVSGTVLSNQASIVFDSNEPIITPVWTHIIDTLPPQSRVASLSPVVSSPRFEVKWSGSDAHAGVDEYVVYVSVNDSLFQKWKNFTTAVSDTFVGEVNKTYKFYSIAVDRAGNFESPPSDPLSIPDAMTRVELSTNVVDIPQEKLLVYPTVTSGKVMILTPKPVTIEVLGINGHRFEQLQLRQNGQIDLSNKPAGVYLLKLTPQNKVIKVVKY